MQIFLLLLWKLLPLYSLIVLGYIAAKYFRLKKEFLAMLLIYGIIPVVLFTGIATTDLNPGTLSIPLLFFLTCCTVATISYYIGKFFWKDATSNVLGFLSGSSNGGYFGLPVAVALFGNNAIGIVALSVVGAALYSSTFGFFLAAKGKHTMKESIIKALKLPMIYCFVLGVLFNHFGFTLNEMYFSIEKVFTMAFSIFGMMLVGAGLAEIKKFEFDFRFLGISLFAKFFVWPALIVSVLFLDRYFLKIYDPSIHNILITLAIVPVAANITSYVTILKTHPEKVAFATFISTLFALFYIPIVASIFSL